MKILHTADWHLGKTLNNIDLIDDQAHVLHQIVAIIKAEKPDVMLLAGDIYDRSVPPAMAVSLFDEVMSEIILTLKTPVIAIAGNHDSAERVAYCNGILERQGLHLKGIIAPKLDPIFLEDAYGKVYFYPIPYTVPETLQYYLQQKENKIASHQQVMDWVVAQIREQVPATARAVLILHAFITGGQSSDSERDLYVGQAGFVQASTFAGLDYVALGHLHMAQAFEEGSVRYAGSPMKYSFSEANHHKSVMLINLEGKNQIKTEAIPLKPKRDLHRIRGKIFNNEFIVTSENKDKLNREDLLEITLEDSFYMGNLMGLIQKKFPYAATLRFSDTSDYHKTGTLNLTQLQDLNEVELFETFYKKFNAQKEISANQKNILADILKEIQNEDK